MPGRRHLGEKVDAARAATAAAAVETHGVLGDAVHAEADRPPVKPDAKVAIIPRPIRLYPAAHRDNRV